MITAATLEGMLSWLQSLVNAVTATTLTLLERIDVGNTPRERRLRSEPGA